MLAAVNNFLKYVDDLVWGVPLIVAILLTGIYLTIRLKGIQITKLPKALKYMFENEESGHGEVTSFGALCTALSATSFGCSFCTCFKSAHPETIFVTRICWSILFISTCSLTD